MILAIFQILSLLLSALFYVVIAQVILSWLFVFGVINPQSGFVRSLVDALEKITAPFYRPIKKVMPDFGGIDLSPMVLILAIIILRDIMLPAIFSEIGRATVL